MKERVLLLRKELNQWRIILNNLDKYSFAGVWVMQGKTSDSKKWKRLEVGETCNIRNEVGRDYKEIIESISSDNKEEKSFRRFRPWSEQIKGNVGEKRLNAKYRQISQKYDEIRVHVVLKNENKEIRSNTEVREAMSWDREEETETGAIYWYPAPTKNGISQWKEVKRYE